MKRIILIALAILVLVTIGGGIVLASWNIPAPKGQIEKPVADEKLAK